MAEKLQHLRESVVFVGGAVVELLTDDAYPIPPRISMDVDTIVEISSLYELAAIEKELRNLGFKNDFTSNVICRWLIDGIIVDIMPSSPIVLGFSNKWYPEAIQNAISYELEKLVIKLISAPYFCCNKTGGI